MIIFRHQILGELCLQINGNAALSDVFISHDVSMAKIVVYKKGRLDLAKA